MSSKFNHSPSKPASSLCEKAYAILTNAHGVASSFYHSYQQLRGQKTGGTTTDEEQDLLRAVLVFASAGLDSLVKQLVRDALRAVVDKSEGADAQFRIFVQSKIKRGDGISDRLIADVLVSRRPRDSLLDLLVNDITAESLQSAEQIFRVAAAFDIATPAICPDAKAVNGLKEVFRVRNQIIHEMDVAFDQSNRSRRPRKHADMVSHANTLFDVSARFLGETDKKLQ
jgi:hypothetical protein